MSVGAGMAVGSQGSQMIGGEIQSWAAVLAKQAMIDAYREEQGRQQKFRQQGKETFDTGLQGLGSKAFLENYGTGASGRKGLYSALGAPSSSVKPMPLANLQREQAAASLAGTSQANLGGYNDALLSYGLREQELRRALNQLSNFAGGVASVYPYRMYDAQHSQDQLAQIGATIASMGKAAPAAYSAYGALPQPKQQQPQTLMLDAGQPYNQQISQFDNYA